MGFYRGRSLGSISRPMNRGAEGASTTFNNMAQPEGFIDTDPPIHAIPVPEALGDDREAENQQRLGMMLLTLTIGPRSCLMSSHYSQIGPR